MAVSDSSSFPGCNLLKNRFSQRCFFVNFAKFLRMSFNRTPSDDCFSSLSVDFFRISLLQSTSETVYFMYKLRNFNHQIQWETISQVLFKHLIQEREVTIQNPWKLSLKRLIRNEATRCQPASLWKKVFHISSLMYFAFIFQEYITITSSEEAFKVCEQHFNQEIQTKTSVTCNLSVQLRFI